MYSNHDDYGYDDPYRFVCQSCGYRFDSTSSFVASCPSCGSHAIDAY